MSENVFPTHEIILVRALEERQNCFDIRFQVFHKEQNFSPDTEIDEHDDKAAHFLLRLTPSLTPIGTIRCVKFPGKGPSSPSTYYKLTRLAVLKDYRRYGLGRALVLTLHDWVRQDALKDLEDGKTLTNAADGSPRKLTGNIAPDVHATSTSQSPSASTPSPCSTGARPSSVKIVAHSQIPVKGFYAKIGYEPEAEEFDEDGDLHQKMVLRLPLKPDIHAH